MKMKRLFAVLMLLLSIAVMANVAFAAKQLEGSGTFDGPKSAYVFAKQQAGANFSDIYVCEKFRLFASSTVSQDDTYIRCSLYESSSESIWGKRIGKAEFKSNLTAGGGNWFPSSSSYVTVVNTEDPVDIVSGKYYKTVLYENLPSGITGYYHGWISNSSSGK